MSVSVKNLLLLLVSAIFLNLFIYMDSVKPEAIYKIQSVEPTNEVVVLRLEKETNVNDIKYHHKVKTTYINSKGNIKHSDGYFENIDDAFDMNNYPDFKSPDGILWTGMLIALFLFVTIMISKYYENENKNYGMYILVFLPVTMVTFVNFIFNCLIIAMVVSVPAM